MSIITGTVNSTEPAQDLYNAIYAALGTNANWSLVDDNIAYTRSTARIASVWKCSGAGNSMGVDYYVVLSRLSAAGATQVTLSICESWNATTHQGSNYGSAVSTSSTATGAISGFSPAALTSNFWGEGFVTATASVNADYFILISNSRLAFGVNQVVGGNLARFATLVTPYTPVAGRTTDAVPVVVWGGTTTSAQGYVTRTTPNVAGALWFVIPYAPQPTRGTLTANGVNNSPDINAVEAVPAWLRAMANSGTWDTNINNLNPNAWSHRGVIPNTIIVAEANTPSFPKNGDTITIGTDTYVRFGGGNGNVTPQQALWLKDGASI